MKKYTIITLVLIAGLVFGMNGITSIQQADAVAKSKCKGNTYDGGHFKLWTLQNEIDYNAIDACVTEGWTIGGTGMVFFATKK